MITPAFGLTATERALPRLALNFTTASLDSRITFTRTTGASNPATYIDSSGVITAAANNQPRFDYDPVTLVCKGLLIEESRTNALLNSDTLSTQSVTVTAAARTLSFYGTGQIVLSGAHSATVTGTGAYPTRTTLTFTPSAGTLTLTVTGTVQYAQLEAGAFATSYIPTTTTALTRNADVATMTGTNFSDWFNASEGTFVVSGAVLNNAGPFQVDDGTTANRMYCTIRPSGSVGGPGAVIVGSAIQTGSFGNFTNLTNNTAALSYKTDQFFASLNGNTPTSDLSGSLPTVDRLRFMNNTTTTNTGTVSKLLYYSIAMTNNQIRAVSKG